MEFSKYKGMYIRKDFEYVDKAMVQQCEKNYALFSDLEGAVVMDWGMNIGAFGKMMLKHPIKQYIGVECHPDNFEVCKANLGDDPRVVLINAAVTALEVDTIELCLTRSKQAYCSGTVNPKGGKGYNRPVRLQVPAIHTDELFSEYNPTHFKCDIEGEEFRILEHWKNAMPSGIKQFAFELHWGDRIVSDYEHTLKKLWESQGFECLYENLNYVKALDNSFIFNGEKITYRNIWGLDCFFKKK